MQNSNHSIFLIQNVKQNLNYENVKDFMRIKKFQDKKHNNLKPDLIFLKQTFLVGHRE